MPRTDLGGERSKKHDSRVESSARALERRIAGLARGQHGVVARWQLLDLGVQRGTIWHRLDSGRWSSICAGVYLLGHAPLTREGTWMAAVLAGGRRAVLSHRPAAALWGLSDSWRGLIDVTAPTSHQHSNVRFHRSRLPSDEVTVLEGIPVTTLPRTLLDNAAVQGRARFERILQAAEFRRLTDPLSLPVLVDRYPGRRGVGIVKSVLADGRFGASITKRELELRFVEFIDRHSLPRPILNGMVATGRSSFEVDCHWPSQRLAVELDGRGAHQTAAAFEADRARDRALGVAGWRVIRITWRQLHLDAAALAADLRALLAPAAPTPGSITA